MSMSFKLFNTGYCSSLKKLAIKTAPWRCHRFPAMFALIQHPQHGNILFDTGHSERFHILTHKFPMRIYSWLVSVDHNPKFGAANQLEEFGIKPEEINYIIISHFHADHIGALNDFPNAKFIYLQTAYDAVKDLNCFSALKAGFLSGLIPNDFMQRSQPLGSGQLRPLPKMCFPFTTGYNIFDDEDIFAIELPGHAEGQLGLFLKTASHEKIFLIADACWSSQSYLELIPPHTISFLAMAGKKEYMNTLAKIHELKNNSPDIKIVPSHCNAIWDEIV
ncbi:MAG: MBL fold metallo-hydrolase [Gammaproteobacteria bacterium]|nr:MBL fold metallo-hydrolase [Gammaproteobacteria bacterium]